MFAIEGCRGTLKPAGLCIARPIEPEPDVERVDRRKARKGIESKNLVEKNGPDRHRSRAIGTDMNIGLIPGEPEAGEVGIGRTVSQLVALLDGKEVEIQVRLKAAQTQDQRIVELAACYFSSRPRCLVGVLEAGPEGLVWKEAEVRVGRRSIVTGERREHQRSKRNYSGTFHH